MSTVISISTRRRYGVTRVCRVWGAARAGVYRRRCAGGVPLTPRRRPGPQGPMPDAALVEAIRQYSLTAPFTARAIARSGRGCAMRACERRGSGCAAHARERPVGGDLHGQPRGPRNHDGTIIPEAIDTMWGTDMTATFTVEHGQVAVFVAVDHCSAECVGIHAALHGTRH